jgi:hypothetical protein
MDMIQIPHIDGDSKYTLPEEFIEGLRLSRHGPELFGYLHTYVGNLKDSGKTSEEVQKMLDVITEYSVRMFGEKFYRDKQGTSRLIQPHQFSGLLPLFHGFVASPENHNTFQSLEDSIKRFDFVSELNEMT